MKIFVSRHTEILTLRVTIMLCFILAPCCMLAAKQGKNDSAKSPVASHYEGTATNKAKDVITVAFDLIEKEGALSGTIHSSHGDFTITGGSHHGEEVTLEFDAGGTAGTISLKMAEDKLSGTWNAGDDSGSIDVKKAAAPDAGAKGKP